MVTVAARLTFRARRRLIGWDDFFMLLAMVSHLLTLFVQLKLTVTDMLFRTDNRPHSVVSAWWPAAL